MGWLRMLPLVGAMVGCAAAAPPGANGTGSPVSRDDAAADTGAAPPPAPTSDAGGGDDAAATDGGQGTPADGAAAPSPDAGADAESAAHRGPLATFHDALRELECGRRAKHVRLAWLGDSHAQADFWTGAIRTALQQRFGNAGPGFVRVGYRGYRHDGIRIQMHGRWYQRPKPPSTTVRWQDGNLGLGGILSTGYADKPWASITLTDPDHAKRNLMWELCYRLNDPSDEFRLSLSGMARRTIQATGKLGGLRHLALTTQGQATLKVEPREGRPFFGGVTIETDPADRPGVVLDNLGIDGARFATPLAWNPVFWAAELKRRSPELVVIEFGGNEASDYNSRPQAYQRHLLRLIERVRKVLPNSSCLVVGLADRADVESRIAPIRDATRAGAREAKCMFWDTYEVMGGRGSMKRWVDEKKAAADGIHMLPRGYAELGAKLYHDLMSDYRSECSKPSERLPR